MFRQIWFQLHWLLGITAGLVLAVVGVTGGLLSFEHEILRALNPGVITVTPQGARLSPDALTAQVRAALPDERVTFLTVYADPESSARVMFAPPPGERRGKSRYLDPYTGELLGEPRGKDTFQLIMQIHRWLAAGDVGKHIVGASTIALIVLSLSGLYLRWPRQALNWRRWLTFDFKKRGRGFLWDLHAVVGTWSLAFYLLASLTGLYWSYEWYRSGLFALAGVEQPRRAGGGRAEPPAAAAGGAELDAAWALFLRERAADYREASLTLPARSGQPVSIRYLDADPAHERASNTIVLDAAAGAVVRHERYEDKRLGARLLASIFTLHSGSFFGLPGLVLMMIASLAMPLFAITGWMLYLQRRRGQRDARAARAGAGAAAVAGAEPLLIGFASQSGQAEQLAWQSAGALQAAGVPVEVQPLARLDGERLGRFRRALFVVSTFGDGEPPDNARGFARRAFTPAAAGALGGLEFGLLCLGDRQYPNFCGFGRALGDWLQGQGARALFAPVEVDQRDAHALETWRGRLRHLAGREAELPAEPGFGRWRLTERRLLNPGSQGGPTFHLAFEPLAPAALDWQPGDVAEITPPPADGAQAAVREYSIASIPGEGRLQLLVRQVRRPDGLGFGSGWLTDTLALGEEVRLRVRPNPNFRPPAADRPLILIGNGTGLAGLRSHLAARESGRNWLIFGERSGGHDDYYGEELAAWRRQGRLRRLDTAFSRDLAGRTYVQDRLRAAAEELTAWVADGAAIYVCGSAEGMAGGVDAALREILGSEAVEALVEQGRYRRDVY